MLKLVEPSHYFAIGAIIINLILLLVALCRLLLSEADHQLSQTRILLSLLVPSTLAHYAFKRKSVTKSGCVVGTIFAHGMILSSEMTIVALLVCFFVSAKATRYGFRIKRAFEANFKDGGQRDWLQVTSNLGIVNMFTLIRLIMFGPGDRFIDFSHSYWNSWLQMVSLIGLSCVLGDTLSSELGPILAGDVEPLLITNFKPVPKGTNGGITIAGLICSCLGGLFIGVGSWITLLLVTQGSAVVSNSAQWPLILFCLYGGFAGSVFDSLLGATFQYTGYDHIRKRIIEVPPEAGSINKYHEHISGRYWLDNHQVNFISVFVISLGLSFLCGRVWPL